MHIMKSFHVRIAIVWNVNRCLCVIACAFRGGSNPCRKIQLLGIAHPVVRKQFLVLEVCQGMKLIQDLGREEKARFGLVLYFVNFG